MEYQKKVPGEKSVEKLFCGNLGFPEIASLSPN
jgi:hypothetical protein